MYMREPMGRDPHYSASPSPYQDPYSGQLVLPQIGWPNPPPSFHKPNPLERLHNAVDNRSFIDGFDNNSSGLIQEKSHARNLKRLFNNEDPYTERAKEDKMRSYRDELQRQMEEVKERKRIEKEKIEKEELERERKFYEEFKIQAQPTEKDNRNSGGEHLTMMRTAQNYRRKNQTTEPNIEQQAEKVHKRGGYHNQSSLDQFEGSKQPENEAKPLLKEPREPRAQKRFTSMAEELAREKNIEEERISKLMLFQQRVLQKISDIKAEIRKTSSSIDTEKELNRVRNSLRARRPHMEDLAETEPPTHRGSASIHNFYSLPKRNPQTTLSRYSVRLRGLERHKLSESLQEGNEESIEESPVKDEGESVM